MVAALGIIASQWGAIGKVKRENEKEISSRKAVVKERNEARDEAKNLGGKLATAQTANANLSKEKTELEESMKTEVTKLAGTI